MRWHDLSLESLLTFLRAVTTPEAVERLSEPARQILFQKGDRSFKYDGRTLGQYESLENILTPEVVGKLLRHELTVRVVGSEVVIEPASVLIYDKNGRRIPPRGMKSVVCDADYGFSPTQVAQSSPVERLDYGFCPKRFEKFPFAEKLCQTREAFNDESLEFVSAEEFNQRINGLVQKIEKDETSRNVLKGAWYPFCIPGGLGVTAEDYGEKLDNVLVPAMARAYKKAFPARPFNNNLKGQLSGEVKIWKGSRHEKVLEAASKGPVVGIYFPTALQGYSINADREQMETLPEMFLLAGGLDTMAAMNMYASELLRDNQTPCYDMAALAWRGWSLGCCAFDDDASFNGSQHLDIASGVFTGELVALS